MNEKSDCLESIVRFKEKDWNGMTYRCRYASKKPSYLKILVGGYGFEPQTLSV